MAARLKVLLSRWENVYAVLALCVGLPMALLNPPFSGVPDEHAHYWKSWAVALGEFVCRPENTIPRTAYDLPLSNMPAVERLPGVGKRIVFGETLRRLGDADSDELMVGGRAVCGATPLGFLPQAVGLRAGKALHLSPLADFFLARVCNLLAAVALVWLAIRVMPFGKIVLVVVGMLPMTIQQFASLDYDALHISLCLLFIAFVTRLATAGGGPIPAARLALLSVVGLLAFNVKFGYAGLALLVFMLPAGSLGTRRRYALFTAGFLALNALVFLAAYRYFSSTGGDGSGGIPGVNAPGQALSVAFSPLGFLDILVKGLYWNVHFYLESFLFRPGWLDHGLPPLFHLSLIAGMFLLLKTEDEPVTLSGRQRAVLLLTFLANFLVVFFALYVGWTRVGAKGIEGVQGRYLLGIAPLAILGFYKARFSYRTAFTKRHLHALLICFYLAIFAAVFVNGYNFFYDKRPDVPLPAKIMEKLLGR